MTSEMIMNDYDVNPFLASPLGEVVDFPSIQSPEEFASLFLFPDDDDQGVHQAHSPPLLPLPPTPQIGALAYSSAFSTVSSSPLSLNNGEGSPFEGFGFDLSFASSTTLGLSTPEEEKPATTSLTTTMSGDNVAGGFTSLFSTSVAPSSSVAFSENNVTWSPIDVPLPTPISTAAPTISPSLTRLPSPAPITPSSAHEDQAIETTSFKKDKHTGTRNTKIPAIPLDAPTMSRTYLIPASTSRKRAPAAITSKLSSAAPSLSNKRAKKSSSSSSSSTDLGTGMDVGEEGLDPSLLPEELLSAIEEKRRSNTLAARKSRMRKAGHLKDLEARLEAKEGECEALKKRCQELEEMVRTLTGC